MLQIVASLTDDSRGVIYNFNMFYYCGECYNTFYDCKYATSSVFLYDCN
jgi:hypothetical protein